MVKKEKRKILFRGKCKATNLWYYGFLYKDCFILGGDEDFMHGEYRDTIDKTWIDDYMYCVDPETVGRFTGLCDRNGKEIFEGDILKDCDKYIPRFKKPIAIGWDDCGFNYKEKGSIWWNAIDDHEYGISDFENFKVIGNIHDNPELLEAHNG